MNMANVILDFYDLDADALPETCMKCAEPPVTRKNVNFSWTPMWARFMPWWLQMAFVRRRRVNVPLCERHKNLWVNQYVVGLGGLALVVLLFVAGGAMAANSDKGDAAEVLGAALLIAGGVAFLVWLVALIVLSLQAITVVNIDDYTIKLRNVSKEFVAAYEELARPMARDVDDAVREKFRRAPGGRPPLDDPRRPGRAAPDDAYDRPDDAYER
jgi:hypothetical protein